jgi:transcriptional regulator with GAF, ATPase, and Fis domain
LNDTLNLVQLARETALAQGKDAQAQRLSPVVKDLRSMVNTSRESQPHTEQKPAAPSGILAQNDFKTLLEAAKKTPSAAKSVQSGNSVERNQMVMAMSAGNMSDVDIARQLGMTREEVHLVLSVGQKA